MVVFDRSGKELTRKEGQIGYIAGSRMHTLAVLANKQVFECALDPAPVWTEIAITRSRCGSSIADASSRCFSSTAASRRGPARSSSGARSSTVTPFMREVHDDVLVWLRDDGDLQWIGDLGRDAADSSVVNRARLAGRAGVPRVAVVADGVIVVYDLTAAMPRRVAGRRSRRRCSSTTRRCS